MKKKNYLLGFALFISTMVLAQKSSFSKDNPITIAAPHLPAMIKYSGEGPQFYGGKYVYDGEQCNAKLKAWMKAYAGELEKYKVVISKYLDAMDETKLSAKEAELYNDLKTQWMMIRQQPGFYKNEATIIN